MTPTQQDAANSAIQVLRELKDWYEWCDLGPQAGAQWDAETTWKEHVNEILEKFLAGGCNEKG